MLMTQAHNQVAAPGSRSAYQHIEVTQVGGVIGAVVRGIRVGDDIDPAAVAELRAALLTHKVVFLRDQQPATDADQRAYTRRVTPAGTPN
jgi:alpha-ketoglutarate-dependent taurine dioxygenase